MSKKKKIIIISASIVLVVALLSLVLYFAFREEPGITMYKSVSTIKMIDYSSDGNIKKLFSDSDVLVMHVGSSKIYRQGEYVETNKENLLILENGILKSNTAFLNEMYGTDMKSEYASSYDASFELNTYYVEYEDRMVIYTKTPDRFDVFRDLYTLEALSLRLKGADELDLVNSFIDLPKLVGNGQNNAVFYSEPNLHLGLQTSVYYNQLGETTVKTGPAIVAGEGENKKNSTLVRVFNEQQTCVTQFLAYPVNVTGGVQVKAVGQESGEVLIATSPYVKWPLDARKVRVFDTFGTRRMDILPEGISAPYMIVSGRFVNDSNEEQLLITELSPSSNVVMKIYSLSKGALLKTVNVKLDVKPKGNILISVRQNSNSIDSLIFFFKDQENVYEVDMNTGKAIKVDINLPKGANGVYASNNEGEYIVTADENELSNITIINKANNQSILDVGRRENRFYSSYADNNPDGYVDYAAFNHVRVDISSAMMSKLTNAERAELLINNSTYADWDRKLGANEVERYHSQYNMWEPCFTHRWNRIAATSALVKIIDEDTELPKYASVGRNNEGSEYLELESSFLIGSYADGLLPMSKMRLFPLRSYLQALANQFRGKDVGEPEKLVAVSPVHEHEINVAGSIGDYNYSMILGFRRYLLDLYGSIEKINDKFSTSFTSINELDPPRNQGRGDWDRYGDNDYFTQWSIYTRFIVNKRIIEAYREALVAGFPPESINSHQIPEGDAVSGFLGEADTRLSPIDVVMSCGTAFGGTRYSYWFENEHNWISLARLAGHKNITIGEYCSLTNDKVLALKQLTYLFNNGVKMISVLVPLDSKSPDYAIYSDAEKYAINEIQKANVPRPGYTGGTAQLTSFVQDGEQYNIVQIGTGVNQNGLLKSINQDGSWEGTVYVVPFHSHVSVDTIDFKGSKKTSFKSEDINKLQHGDQVEITFDGKYNAKGKAYVKFQAYYDGVPLENSFVTYEITNELQSFRYVFTNQLALTDKVNIVIDFEANEVNKIDVNNMQGTVQRESVARRYFGDFNSVEHVGGITYDILTK